MNEFLLRIRRPYEVAYWLAPHKNTMFGPLCDAPDLLFAHVVLSKSVKRSAFSTQFFAGSPPFDFVTLLEPQCGRWRGRALSLAVVILTGNPAAEIIVLFDN